MTEERLQKVLSRIGFGSRRDCEKLIINGHVQINHQAAIIGMKVDPQKDIIEVNEELITYSPPKEIFIAFNKPQRVLSEIKKQDDRSIVLDYINIDKYLFIIGRLDFESEGLILLTNNGDIANKLTHPRFEHEKEYHVLCSRPPDVAQLEIWRRGVVIERGIRTKPAVVERLDKDKDSKWIRVILREGKKRQIREVGMTIGLPIKRIIRTRIGPIQLGKLKPGEWRFLNPLEIKKLHERID